MNNKYFFWFTHSYLRKGGLKNEEEKREREREKEKGKNQASVVNEGK